jgi:hypothetical protein
MADDAQQEQDGEVGTDEQCDAAHGCLSNAGLWEADERITLI